MKHALRRRAMILRQKGWSYKMIGDTVSVSKSTLSHWLRNIPYYPNRTVLRRIKLGTTRSNLSRNKRKMESISAGKKHGVKQIGQISKRDLLLLGIGYILARVASVLKILKLRTRILRLSL